MLFNSPLYGVFLVGTCVVFWLAAPRAARPRALPRRRELRLLLLRDVRRRARASPCRSAPLGWSAPLPRRHLRRQHARLLGRPRARPHEAPRRRARRCCSSRSSTTWASSPSSSTSTSPSTRSRALLRCAGRARARRRTCGSCCPFGISFFTFETMSYTIDVYRARASARESLPRLPALRLLLPAPRRRAHRAPAARCSRSSRADPSGRRGDEGARASCSSRRALEEDRHRRLPRAATSSSASSTTPSASPSLEVLVAVYAYADPDLRGLLRLHRRRDRERRSSSATSCRRTSTRPTYRTNLQEFWHRWHISLSHVAARLPLHPARRHSRRRRGGRTAT